MSGEALRFSERSEWLKALQKMEILQKLRDRCSSSTTELFIRVQSFLECLIQLSPLIKSLDDLIKSAATWMPDHLHDGIR